MRIAQAHQQRYNGFAWDHPLREQWRTRMGEDPCTGDHSWHYSLRGPVWYGLVLLVSVFFGGMYLLTAKNVPQQYAGIYIESICVSWVFCVAAGLGWMLEAYEENSRRFNEMMRILARNLKIPHESLPSYGQCELERLARLSLLLEARNVLEVERAAAACPISTEPERVRAKRSFEKTYQSLLVNKLINDCGYGPFFQKAKEELDRAI